MGLQSFVSRRAAHLAAAAFFVPSSLGCGASAHGGGLDAGDAGISDSSDAGAGDADAAFQAPPGTIWGTVSHLPQGLSVKVSLQEIPDGGSDYVTVATKTVTDLQPGYAFDGLSYWGTSPTWGNSPSYAVVFSQPPSFSLYTPLYQQSCDHMTETCPPASEWNSAAVTPIAWGCALMATRPSCQLSADYVDALPVHPPSGPQVKRVLMGGAAAFGLQDVLAKGGRDYYTFTLPPGHTQFELSTASESQNGEYDVMIQKDTMSDIDAHCDDMLSSGSWPTFYGTTYFRAYASTAVWGFHMGAGGGDLYLDESTANPPADGIENLDGAAARLDGTYYMVFVSPGSWPAGSQPIVLEMIAEFTLGN